MPGVLKGIKYEDPVVRYRAERTLRLARKLGSEAKYADISLSADIFYTLYLPVPILVPREQVPVGQEMNYAIIKSLIDNPEVQKVKVHTIADSFTTTLISASLIHYIGEELQNEMRYAGRGEASGESTDEELINRIVDRAVKNVKDEIGVIKGMRKLISEGTQPGTGTVLDLEESGDEVIRLARNTDVRKLINIISLIPDLARKFKRKVSKSSKGEFVGYEVGSDVERIVPTELLLPKIYFRVKLVEGKILLYDKVLPKSFGPFYVLVDKSGSMEGEKIKWAKATAIAMFMRARRERRDFYLRFFDGLPHPLVKVPKRMKPDMVITLIKYLARVRGGGGTDITRAIVTACDDLSEGVVKGPTDIIIITDGEDRVSDRVIAKKLKSVDARLITVMIIGENSDLRRLSYKYFRAVKLSQNEILQVVEA